MIPGWNSATCLRCGACAGTCPEIAITLGDTGISFDEARCTGCFSCVRICPVSALGGGRI